jgi:hypothetical protein
MRDESRIFLRARGFHRQNLFFSDISHPFRCSNGPLQIGSTLINMESRLRTRTTEGTARRCVLLGIPFLEEFTSNIGRSQSLQNISFRCQDNDSKTAFSDTQHRGLACYVSLTLTPYVKTRVKQ